MDMQEIAWVSSPRTELPDDDGDTITFAITLNDSRFTADSLRGLESLSHVEVVTFWIGSTESPGCDGMPLARPRWPQPDGTLVLDVKPYMIELAARGEVHQPDWAGELMAGYWDNSTRP